MIAASPVSGQIGEARCGTGIVKCTPLDEEVDPMSKPVRIGVVGCGSVMQDGYMPIAQDLQTHGLVDIRMACDAAPERGAIAEQFSIPAFTTDYRTLVSAADIDLVLVLTPPASHYPNMDHVGRIVRHMPHVSRSLRQAARSGPC
jgi:hypothetical protein